MTFIVRIVTEETFKGLVTGYVGPFGTPYAAQEYVDEIEAHHAGEFVEVYVEELHPPC